MSSQSAIPAHPGFSDNAADSAPPSAAEDCSQILEHVLRHTPTILWTLDRHGIITRSQGRGLEGLSLKDGEIVGRNVFEVYADFPEALAAIRAAYQGEQQQLLVPAGGVCFESWMTPIRDHDGEICGVLGVASDVTSRVRAEDSYRASCENFLKAFHASPAGICLSDLMTGRIIDANAALGRLVDCPRELLIGQTVASQGFWPANLITEDALSATKPAPVPRKLRLPRRDGRACTVNLSVELVELDGRMCALSILRRVNRRHRIAQTLQRTRRRYQTLARFAPVGIFRTDAQGNWKFMNDHVPRLFGSQRENLLHEGWVDWVHRDDRVSVLQAWQQAIQARTSLSLEFRSQHADEVRWLLLQLDPARTSGQFMGALTDITRRKLAELELQAMNLQLEQSVRIRTELLTRVSKSMEEHIFERRRTYEDLEKSEERWRALVEAAPDVILLVDRNGQINYINHTSFRPSLGPQQVMGKSVYDFAFEEYREEIKEALRSVFEDGVTLSHQVEGPGDQGERRSFESHLAPIRYMGSVIGATAIVRDVTRVRQAHDELQQTQDRLAHVSRVTMVGQMTASFAHELGQPLYAISSYIDGCLIRMGRGQTLPPDVVAALHDAIAESHRAIEVVRRLREFLQKNEIMRAPANMNDIVRDAVKLADVGLRRYGSQVRMNLADDLPLADLDRIQIMQVLMNLVLNAAEAMAELERRSGEISIVTTVERPGTLVCRVVDQGPGLPSTGPNGIFEEFFTTKPGGLGLGLSISRSIVEAHGGTITAENRSDEPGAVLTVHLPCHSQGFIV